MTASLAPLGTLLPTRGPRLTAAASCTGRWIAWSVPGAPPWTRRLQLVGDRAQLCPLGVRVALDGLAQRLAGPGPTDV
ncbi:hypothetical protein [uncultured Thiodictyon sp.]|jgi:hypothetical protein|uniref:hypothetical protein n=1 Tax=uncultured Thiodictyon sp. TaxID=1846217 RepID=UPI0025FB9DDB|nr:hypothetical protein [uncultured Thiodictyon sp.]